MELATEYMAWCIFGITKLLPIILLTAIIYKAIMNKRKQQRYIRVTYSKGRAYDQDKQVGQYFNEIA